MTRLLIERADGGVSLMEVIDGKPEDALAKWAEIHGEPESVAEAPEGFAFDRRWRDAYSLVNGKPVIDLVAVKIQRLGELISRRDQVMAKVRESIEDAEEKGDATELAALITKRGQLRNIASVITADLDKLRDLDQVEDYVPALLR